MVGSGHNGFLLPVVDWIGWFAISFWAKEKQETVSDFLLGSAADGDGIVNYNQLGWPLD